MFCKYCGKEIENDSKFCPFCGSQVEPEEEALEPVILDENEKSEEKEHKGPWNAFAKVGYILGILGFVLSFFAAGLNIAIPGLVFSILGKRASEDELKEKANKGFKFALAGIIIGAIVSIVLGIVLGALGYENFSDLVKSIIEQYVD